MVKATLHVKIGHDVITLTADMPAHRTPSGVRNSLNEWFVRDAGQEAPFPSGSLLFYSLAETDDSVGDGS